MAATIIAVIGSLSESVADMWTHRQQAAGRLDDSLQGGLALMRDEMRDMQAQQRIFAAQCGALQSELADSQRATEIEQRPDGWLARFSRQERTQRSKELQGSDSRGQRSEEQA